MSDMITKEEVHEFANTLEAWGDSLPERQQVLLQALLAEAAGPEEEVADDVEGYGCRYGGRRWAKKNREQYYEYRQRRFKRCGNFPRVREACCFVLEPICGRARPVRNGETRFDWHSKFPAHAK